MVSRLALIVVGHGLEPRSCQTKDHQIGICCFSLKHVAEVKGTYTLCWKLCYRHANYVSNRLFTFWLGLNYQIIKSVGFGILLFSSTLQHFYACLSQDLEYLQHMSWTFFKFNGLRWKVVVCFVDILTITIFLFLFTIIYFKLSKGTAFMSFRFRCSDRVLKT
jgi:hypothetical protein